MVVVDEELARVAELPVIPETESYVSERVQSWATRDVANKKAELADEERNKTEEHLDRALRSTNQKGFAFVVTSGLAQWIVLNQGIQLTDSDLQTQRYAAFFGTVYIVCFLYVMIHGAGIDCQVLYDHSIFKTFTLRDWVWFLTVVLSRVIFMYMLLFGVVTVLLSDIVGLKVYLVYLDSVFGY